MEKIIQNHFLKCKNKHPLKRAQENFTFCKVNDW